MESTIPIVDEEEFLKYVEIMKARTDVTDKYSKEQRLKLYSSGRQGKFGDNNDKKPGMFSPIEKIKWQAWMDRKGQDQNACRAEFLEMAKQMLGESEK